MSILKGIVSRDFGVLFLIYLDRYEVPNRAGSGLFFLLKRFSVFKFLKKFVLSAAADPGIVTVRRIFREF
jgi:hypothetical protein